MQETFESRGRRVTLRGTDAANPALLVLPGAGLDLTGRADFFAPWEAEFTLVHWDQPATAPLSYGGLAEEAAAVLEAVQARTGHKAGIVATSGGTVPALMAAKARPDLVGAFVGCGTVANRAEQEVASWKLCLARAKAAGDLVTATTLEAAGPPPWTNVMIEVAKSMYANAPTAQEAPEWAAFTAAGAPDPNAPAAAFAAYMALRDELAAYDARALGQDFEVPLVFLQGAEDAHTTTPEVEAYAAWVRAPQVAIELIPDAGHLSFFLREPMRERLVRLVKPLLR